MPYAPPCHPPPVSQASGRGVWASGEAHRASGAVCAWRHRCATLYCSHARC
ncbi:unnamed protein product, partial [Closterium sp. NIES-54]